MKGKLLSPLRKEINFFISLQERKGGANQLGVLGRETRRLSLKNRAKRKAGRLDCLEAGKREGVFIRSSRKKDILRIDSPRRCKQKEWPRLSLDSGGKKRGGHSSQEHPLGKKECHS